MLIGNSNAVAATGAQETQKLLTLAALYSTKIGGTSYPAEVDLSGGSYLATVPALPGVSATGGTLLGAENNLNLRISVLV